MIVFEADGPYAARDQVAWRLLNTPEMQRLRRIRQLGVSEFTFPGATHSRFAHSLGVFHVARQLATILKRVLPDPEWRVDRAEVAVFAALLHDIGHGPFSHAFESVQKLRGVSRHHEDWTADMIVAEEGSIRPILESYRSGMSRHVADLLRAKNPEDALHAIVSSSFDADRLDYLKRDRLMTGSGAGAIDFDWLLDNLAVGEISVGSDDDEAEERIKTFCLKRKALQAAESFLLARYQLFEQIYLYKTTRGMEKIVGLVLGAVADAASSGHVEQIGLDAGDPLVAFFRNGGNTLTNYLALDDTAVWAAAARIARSEHVDASKQARRLLNRERLFCLDIENDMPRMLGEPAEEAEARWRRKVDCIDSQVEPARIKDVITFNAYGSVGADQTRAHMRLSILVDNGPPREITEMSDLIRALPRRELVRYYFDTAKAKSRAMDVKA